jgi:hypothetical protein
MRHAPGFACACACACGPERGVHEAGKGEAAFVTSGGKLLVIPLGEIANFCTVEAQVDHAGLVPWWREVRGGHG